MEKYVLSEQLWKKLDQYLLFTLIWQFCVHQGVVSLSTYAQNVMIQVFISVYIFWKCDICQWLHLHTGPVIDKFQYNFGSNQQ